MKSTWQKKRESLRDLEPPDSEKANKRRREGGAEASWQEDDVSLCISVTSSPFMQICRETGTSLKSGGEVQLHSDRGEQTKLSGCSGDSRTQKGACRKSLSHGGMEEGGLAELTHMQGSDVVQITQLLMKPDQLQVTTIFFFFLDQSHFSIKISTNGNMV